MSSQRLLVSCWISACTWPRCTAICAWIAATCSGVKSRYLTMAAGTSGDESGGETTNVSPETCTSDTGSVSFWGWSSSISCPVLSNWNRIGPDAHGSLTCMRWPGPTDNDTRGPRIAAMLELSDETIATAVLMAG